MIDDESPIVSVRSIRLKTNAIFRANRKVSALTVSLDELGGMNEDEFREFEVSLKLDPLPNFDEHVADKVKHWESFLEREDLPRPDSHVLVRVDDEGVPEWKYVEDSDNDVLRSLTGHSSDRILSGSAYIISVVEEFSPSWWFERLCRVAVNFLTREDQSERLHIAMELGRAEREFEIFLNEHQSVELGRKTAEDRSRGGSSTRRPDHDQIVERMKAYVAKGNSVSNAARLAHKKHALGCNQEANRSLYRSHMKKYGKKTGRR